MSLVIANSNADNFQDEFEVSLLYSSLIKCILISEMTN